MFDNMATHITCIINIYTIAKSFFLFSVTNVSLSITEIHFIFYILLHIFNLTNLNNI